MLGRHKALGIDPAGCVFIICHSALCLTSALNTRAYFLAEAVGFDPSVKEGIVRRTYVKNFIESRLICMQTQGSSEEDSIDETRFWRVCL